MTPLVGTVANSSIKDQSPIAGMVTAMSTFGGMWTVSDPPPEVHRDLISAWELEPDPVTRWHFPIEQGVRVWEIHRPADWVRLVTTYRRPPAPTRRDEDLLVPHANTGRPRTLLAVERSAGRP